MATRLYLRNTKANGIHLDARDLTDLAGFSVVFGTTATTAGGTEIPVNAGTPTEVGEWISDQIDQPVTIEGLMTFKMYLSEVNALANVTVRAKVWKLSAGGSDELTFIGTFDATVEASTVNSTALDFTGTPSVAIEMAQRERFVVRLYVIPAPGQTMGGPYNVEFRYDSGEGAPWCSWLEFTETFSLLGEGAVLYLRSTTVNGISGFLDLLPARGAGLATAVVNTTASGSDIPWTLTAGGAVAEWISPRIARSVAEFTSASPWPLCALYVGESAGQANAQVRARLWKRNLAGTETLIWGPEDMGRELSTSALQLESFGTNRMTASFDEDDRIVLRLYCHNFGTMGSGRTCTLRYDGPSSNWVLSAVTIGSKALSFKIESEPIGSNSVPNGQMMGGVGN